MNSVNCVNCQAQQTENRYKGVRHVANAVVTAGGIAGTGLLLKKGGKMMSNATGGVTFGATKAQIGVKNFFEKFGEKIFKGKVGKLFERYAREPHLSPQEMARSLKFNKGCGAMVLTAGIGALTILAKGIYNAGKIEGQK